MAYQSKDLSVLAYANGFTLWHYTTTDASIATASYFDPAAEMLRIGDMVIANVDTDDVPSLAQYRVSGNAGGAVTVAAV